MPGVLLRALSEYGFVGTPLLRMSDGKDLVRVELTFHKALPTKPYYKRRAESRRQPAPSAGEATRQPVPASRPPPRREPTQIERETLPPPPQTTTQTPLQLPSPHRRLSSDQHQYQRLPSHRRRRSQEKSLQNQRKTAMKNLSRSTRSTTSRMLSATSSVEKTLPSSRPKDSREKKTR